MRTTVRLPDDLLDRARRKAAAEGTTLTGLLEEGLRLVLSEKKMSSDRRPRHPRVCRSGGGLMPGIDPVKLAAESEEQDDLDRLHRTASRP